jgi:hypothetical protein
MNNVISAATSQGFDLPVIDVSNPAFFVSDDAAALGALRAELAESERRRKRLPRFVLRWLMRSLARRSLMARELLGGEPRGDVGVLGGMTTYMMKVGAANLVAPINTELDKRLAASPGAVSIRIRLQQLAELLAGGLRGELAARGSVPLHLISIGGGTAIDCLNTLIVLRKSDPVALEHRQVTLHVLDPDSEGPEFGRHALAALATDGNPLSGLDVKFAHASYNWNEPATLENLVRELSSSDSLIAVSTEGALFEYGNDPTVVSNLEALRKGRNVVLVGGTVTRADPLTREFLTTSRFKLVPRTAAEFAELVKRAGFTVTETKSALLSDQVLLRPLSQ